MATVPHDARPPRANGVRRWVRRRPLLAISAALAAGALAILVGVDGSAPWQIARVVAVLAASGALVAVMARRSERARGRAAVIVGIPAVAIAVGFGAHLVKQGPVPVQVATAVLVVAGLALVVGGTVVTASGGRWWHRGAVVVAVVVALGITVRVVAPAVAVTNVPRPAIGASPADVGLDHVDAVLRTADGVDLAAWYVPSSNRAAVVLLHGAGSTRSNVLDEATVLADAGFGVLMVDARGHGDSGGRAMDFGWHGDADVAAATRYLAAQPDVDDDRIGVVGMSMGGEEAIGASGADARIRAVVAEGATARTADDHAWLSEEHGVRGALQEVLQRVQDRITDLLTSASVPSSLRTAIQSSGETSYLLITAGDVADEAAAAAYMASAAPERVQVWTVPGAGHTDGLETAPDEWTDRVIELLAGALLGTDRTRS